jgi:ectoine hydroxylase-related dioxygenase (phytanoyl-CoA dioxygenase family)
MSHQTEDLHMDTTTFDLSKPFPVTADESARYRRDGHILLRGIASPEELAHFRPLIMSLVEEIARTRDIHVRLDDLSPLFTEVSNVWRRSEAIRAFILAERFARVAAELMGVKAVRLYHDQALIKDPGASPTPWHKDHYSWPLATHHTIKMWLALSDISAETGGMVFATGSHHSALFPEVPYSKNLQEIFCRVIKDHQIPTPSYAMQAGDATFHSGDTLHSTLENSSPSRREVLSIIYYADATRVMIPDHEHRRVDLQEFLPGLNPGEIAASDLNPLLYEARS